MRTHWYTPLVSALLAFSSSAYCQVEPSQELSLPKIREMHFDSEAVRKAFIDNVISSADDKTVIPDNVYYLIIFQKIQAESAPYLTTEDWKIIKNLPSHKNKRFEDPIARDTLEACRLVLNSGGMDVLEIAARWDDVRIRNDASLDAHYGEILTKLSPNARAHIAALKNEMADSNSIGYSSFSMLGFAADMPDVARRTLESGCTGILSEKDFFPVAKDQKLIDEPLPGAAFGKTSR
jgi:hypothetical protein